MRLPEKAADYNICSSDEQPVNDMASAHNTAIRSSNGDEPPARRKLSLASELETMTQSGAFLRAIEEGKPEVAVCRAILQKQPGRRSIDDIHMLKSLLATSKLLEFFSNLDAYKIDKLYQSIELAAYEDKGAFVFEEDDPGESFYMVFRGQVEIRQRDKNASSAELNSKRPPTVHIAFLNPGDSFGERALLFDSDRRAASAIIASDSAELIFINRTVFTDLLKESHAADAPGTALEVTKRFRSNKDIIRNIFMRPSVQRSEKDLKFAVEYLKSVKFFSRFSFEVRKQLCRAMRLISAVTNTVLFEEGQEGRHFYIIFTGNTEVSVRTKNRFDETSDNVVSRLGEGEYFGELALSETGGLRRATVTCADFCELLVLSREKYEPLIKKYQNEYHAQYAKILSKNPYFIGPEWDSYTIQAMCAVMAEKYFPFRAEICKQGSRATEMFVITRGECVIVHDGKHPITGKPQQYELGRFSQNSVLGCAEASAGRFNDIFIRDYSIIAESPVRVLVLSRFDIFHLMSPTARESLQRSSVGYMRESIESRALKSVTWEKYRKDFLADIIGRKEKEAGIGADRGPTSVKTLGKSSSTPTLATVERVLKPLIEPGELVLQPRLGCSSSRKTLKTLSRVEKRDSPVAEAAKAPVKEDQLPEQNQERRRNTVHTGSEEAVSTKKKGKLEPSREARDSGEPSRVPTDLSASMDEETVRSEIPPMKPVRARRQSLIKSKTFALLEQVNQQPSTTLASLPQLFQEKPLYGAAPSSAGALTTAMNTTSATSSPSTSDRRRSVRLRSDAGIKMFSAAATTTAIWNPVHGVCQPFAVVGFMRERPKPPVPIMRASRGNGGTASASSSVSSVALSSKIAFAGAESPGSDAAGAIVTAFRVLGKFTELNDALELFRHVCSLETIPPSTDRDTSRFAIYKEDEITMTMENYFNSLDSTQPPTPYQYRALDLPQGNGQRYACVSVSVETPPRQIENVAVQVYQCLPTLQSAVRFAKQVGSATLASMVLYVVPLFEWVPLAEIDRFDAKNADLEQALESITLASSTASTDSSGRPLSTWKARKDAMKKARVHALKRA